MSTTPVFAIITLFFAFITLCLAVLFVYKSVLHGPTLEKLMKRNLTRYQWYQLLTILQLSLLIILHCMLIIVGRVLSSYPKQSHAIYFNPFLVATFGLAFIFYTFSFLYRYKRLNIDPNQASKYFHPTKIRYCMVFFQLFPMVPAITESVISSNLPSNQLDLEFRHYTEWSDVRLICKIIHFGCSVIGITIFLGVETFVELSLLTQAFRLQSSNWFQQIYTLLKSDSLFRRIMACFILLVTTDGLLSVLYSIATIWPHLVPEYESYCVCSCWLMFHIFAAFTLLDLLMRGLREKKHQIVKGPITAVPPSLDYALLSKTDLVEEGLLSVSESHVNKEKMTTSIQGSYSVDSRVSKLNS